MFNLYYVPQLLFFVVCNFLCTVLGINKEKMRANF